MPRVSQRTEEPTRPVLYPDILILEYRGDDRMFAERSKELLGWREVGDGEAGSEYDFLDVYGRKIVCDLNADNRPFDRKWAMTRAQDILNRRWRFNGETIIIGRTGRVLSAQHRLIGLVFAWQLWNHPDRETRLRWRKLHPEEPCIESLVVLGVSEDADTVRTLDNVKERSLADVFFTDRRSFGDCSRGDRTKLTRILQTAVAYLRLRTGASRSDTVTELTHSEGVEWLAAHPRLRQAVREIYRLNGTGKPRADRIASLIAPGYAAALLYLTACSATEPASYREAVAAGKASERNLNFAHWHQATEFWSLLAARSPLLEALLTAKRPLIGQSAAENPLGPIFAQREGGSLAEKVSLLAAGWRLFRAGERLTEELLAPDYDIRVGDDGTVTGYGLATRVTVGGIDAGEPSGRPRPRRIKAVPTTPAETQEEFVETGMVLPPDEPEPELPPEEEPPVPVETILHDEAPDDSLSQPDSRADIQAILQLARQRRQEEVG